MPILSIQQQLREIGRIRCGDSAGGKPNKLDCFRLTSADKTVLEAAAKLYGGTVRPWASEPGQFELYITATELPILVAPVPVDQWYEQWSKGGCTHRCDGATNIITEKPCTCDLSLKAKVPCKITTRVSVMLPELPSLGVWRLESHGYYAGSELPTSVQFLQEASKRGGHVPATLAIEHRKRVANSQTKRYIVPVIRVRAAISGMLNIRGVTDQEIEPMPQAIATSDALALPSSKERAIALAGVMGWSSIMHREAFSDFKASCRTYGLDPSEAVIEAIEAGCKTLDHAMLYVAGEFVAAEPLTVDEDDDEEITGFEPEDFAITQPNI